MRALAAAVKAMSRLVGEYNAASERWWWFGTLTLEPPPARTPFAMAHADFQPARYAFSYPATAWWSGVGG